MWTYWSNCPPLRVGGRVPGPISGAEARAQVDLVTFETFRRSLTSRRYRDIALNIQESMAEVQEEAR